MKITIKDKNSINNYIPSKKAILIRIEDIEPFNDLKYKNKYIEEKRFTFLDIDYDMDYSITDIDIETILSFIKKHKNDTEEIVIQCLNKEGICPAIALSISEIFDFNINIKKNKNFNYFIYNKFLTLKS